MTPSLSKWIESMQEGYQSIVEWDFNFNEAATWSIVYSVRWVFGGLVGGVMAAVFLANLDSGTTWQWAGFLLVFSFFVEFMLRVSMKKEDI